MTAKRDLRSEQQAIEAEKHAKVVAERLKSDLKELLDRPSFRRVVWRWLKEAGLFTKKMTLDANDLFEQTGRENFGKFIWNELQQADQIKFFEMLNEANKGVI